jgi:hypothetical protein
MSGTPHTKVQENRKRRNWLPFVVVQVAILAAIAWWLWGGNS